MRLRIFSASSGGECQLRRENNQYNFYNDEQRFAGTRRYASNKPSARETTRYNSFARTCVEPNSLLSRENNQYNLYKKIQRFARTRRYASNKPSAW